MEQEIVFAPIKGFEKLVIKPKPAKAEIPEWYKTMPLDIPHQGKPTSTSLVNFTSKRCMPLLDGMTAGYYLYSYCDVQVVVDNGCSKFIWTHDTEPVANHPRAQFPGAPLPVGYYKDEAFKWFNPVSMKTPKGYSTLFISPLLKHELPFLSFPAIVDTDTYSPAIHFPFLVRKNWEGKIPRGTPIIQAIPFKRDDWKMQWSDIPTDNVGDIALLKTMFNSAYKKMNWVKKYFI
jgi:hypothetical protein